MHDHGRRGTGQPGTVHSPRAKRPGELAGITAAILVTRAHSVQNCPCPASAARGEAVHRGRGGAGWSDGTAAGPRAATR